MEYYAHSENDKGKKHLLKDHLLDTAVIAEGFGKDEYEKAIFRFAALCHDAGKYSDAFQKYLIEGGTRGRIPHAIFGAIVTKNIT
ncbi:MAG: CRISPR-associated endonuclease Cas3'', partial [Candidatus Hydrogenedentes bacterium CG1_02_42_14]